MLTITCPVRISTDRMRWFKHTGEESFYDYEWSRGRWVSSHYGDSPFINTNDQQSTGWPARSSFPEALRSRT